MSKIDHLTEYKKSTLLSFTHHHTQEDIKLKYLLSNQLDSNRERIPFLRLFKSILIRLFWSKLFAPVREQAIHMAYTQGKSETKGD